MKQRHVAGARLDAVLTLSLCNIHRSQDFHSLSSTQVKCLLKSADENHYQKPKSANGSRARYFHALLVRRAGAKSEGEE